VAEERSGVALGTHSPGDTENRSGGISLDEWAHEDHDGDEVASLDAPPEDRFGDAVLAHHEQLARFAFMLSGDREVGEDSVTETYARLWPKFRRGRIANALPDLVRDVIVEVQERTRRTNRRVTPDRDSEECATPWEALQHLPIEQRSAVVLHVVEGIDLDEAAELLGDPVDITATRIDVGMDRIAKLLVTGRSGSRPDA
jgi:DNA-directed RNA polymerase specialized sigma24 family protein